MIDNIRPNTEATFQAAPNAGNGRGDGASSSGSGSHSSAGLGSASHAVSEVAAHVKGPLREHLDELLEALTSLVRVEGWRVIEMVTPSLVLARRAALIAFVAWVAATVTAVLASCSLVVAALWLLPPDTAVRTIITAAVVLVLVVAILCESCVRAVRKMTAEVMIMFDRSKEARR